MTAEEIRQMIAGGETLHAEFKSATVHPDALAAALVSFLNTEGGVLLLGVEDACPEPCPEQSRRVVLSPSTALRASLAEVKESDMTMQTVQIEVPGTLLERARVQTLDEAQELITFLLEDYLQGLEKAQRRQAYETYYAARTPEDEAEELGLLADFAFALIPRGEGGLAQDSKVLTEQIRAIPHLPISPSPCHLLSPSPCLRKLPRSTMPSRTTTTIRPR